MQVHEEDNLTVLYDERLPRPPKYIDRTIDSDELENLINAWDGRGVKPPSLLTEDLSTLDDRMSTVEQRLSECDDKLETNIENLREELETDRARRDRFVTAASYGAIAGVGVIVVLALLAYLFASPELSSQVVTTGFGSAVGIALGAGLGAYLIDRE